MIDAFLDTRSAIELKTKREEQENKATVFTEGKTDWKHLQKANSVLSICPGISFHQSDEEMGDSKLQTLCESLAVTNHTEPMIFVFDRDKKEVIKKVTEGVRLDKSWGNNVYSLVLSIPLFRNGHENVSIEMLYQDADLKRKDHNGRRLFLTSEFEERSGNHRTDPTIHVGNKDRIRGFTGELQSKIVDADIGVYDSENKSIALSKADFAENIYGGKEGFSEIDFAGFRDVLLAIRNIIDTSKGPPREILTPEVDEHTRIPVEAISDGQPRDHPPRTPIFVGRDSHIKKLDDPHLRVAAITGLGGEGKSSLASKFYEKAQSGLMAIGFSKFGWCDCKELESTFHERLLFLLEELSGGKETRHKYSDEHVADTVARFIRHLGMNDCLVIFDNVDAFVDKDSSCFADTVKVLFEQITERLSRGLVIFTCRPAIHDYHQSFLEIPVTGLTFNECSDLLKQLNIPIEEHVLRDIHDRTKGHALWLNLIFGQIRSGRIPTEKIQTLLSSSSYVITDLNTRLLRSIWEKLTPKEKDIIWVLTSFTRPQDVTRIERTSGISYHRCVKLLRTLVLLRLVLEVDVSGVPNYDLHPIIRAKARAECGKARLRHLTARAISILIPSGFPGLAILVKSSGFSRASIENYIESTEIAIENGDFQNALKYLDELSSSLWRIGEEAKFIDLTKRFFDNLDQDKFKVGIDSSMTEIFETFVGVLLLQGYAVAADKYLIRLQNTMQTIKQMMTYAEMRGYYLWFQNEHQKAVEFMEVSIGQVKTKGEEVTHKLQYNYGLALRDAGRIDEAIEIFRAGRDWEKLEKWDSKSKEDLSTDIGNLGRCYYLKEKYPQALSFVKRSSEALRKDETKTDRVNYGYALLWLADIYVKMDNYAEASVHIKQVIDLWKEHAPARIAKVNLHIKDYPMNFRSAYNFPELSES